MTDYDPMMRYDELREEFVSDASTETVALLVLAEGALAIVQSIEVLTSVLHETSERGKLITTIAGVDEQLRSIALALDRRPLR